MVYFPRIGTAEYTVKVIETRLLQVPKFKCQRTPGQTVHASTKLTPTHAPISHYSGDRKDCCFQRRLKIEGCLNSPSMRYASKFCFKIYWCCLKVL